MKRQLTEIEKNICRKGIKRLREELEHLQYLERYNRMMINEGLFMNYKQKVREFKVNQDEVCRDIEINLGKIRVLDEHINKGVEVKEDKRNPAIG